MEFSPGKWMLGFWDILPEDRDPQTNCGLCWTFIESENGDSLSHGPSGRKAASPDYIITPTGWEWDGIEIDNEADKRVIILAKEIFIALKDLAGPCFNTGMYGPLGIRPGECTCGTCRAKKLIKEIES